MTKRAHTPEDYRILINAYEEGNDIDIVAQSVGIHPHTASRILREYVQEGKTAPRKRGRKTRKYDKEQITEYLVNLLGDPNHADATLEELRAVISLGPPVGLGIEPAPSRTTISEWLDGVLITIKKAHPFPAERNSDRVKNMRKEYAEWYLALGDRKKNVVFIDEHGMNLWTRRTRARSRRGQPAHVQCLLGKGAI